MLSRRDVVMTQRSRARQRSYVPTTALAQSITFGDDMMHVAMIDGRVLSVPIIWFPALHKANSEQLAKYEIGAGGRSLHWPDLDEDLSMAGLMAGVDLESA
jgi:Protein of unknown function (DUF2442)